MIRTCLGMCMAVVLALAVQAHAVPMTNISVPLKDANSDAVFVLDDSDPSLEGMTSWVVDGCEHLVRQWFWYRTEEPGPESPISALTLDAYNAQDLNGETGNEVLYACYSGSDLRVELAFTLSGGMPGTGVANLSEIIKVTNIGTETLMLDFFQYADFDLSNGGSDTVEIAGYTATDPGNAAYQYGSAARIVEGVITSSGGMLQEHQAGLKDGTDTNDILQVLSDADADDLTGEPGPLTGDAVWGFQWCATLDPGDELIISKAKHVVPEPATMALMGVGSAVAFLLRRRR